MSLKAGLVGLPNVGKSTLFNALTQSNIPAENYPFCTVDPHIAITQVPDQRLYKLAQIAESSRIIHANTQFVDIAGLVKGAAQGEGLGNQFLSTITGVDLILHVVRCFDDTTITHVNNTISPLDDLDIICTELMLKDLEILEKRKEKIELLYKKIQSQKNNQILKELDAENVTLSSLKQALSAGDLEHVQQLCKDARENKSLHIDILSGKNFLIIANVSEDDFSGENYTTSHHFQQLITRYGKERVIAVSAKIEAELAQLEPTDAHEFMASLNINESGLNKIIAHAYNALNRISFFTVGAQEARAWSIERGTKAVQAAGTIHSDMQRGFICSEVYHCDDLIALGTEYKLKEAGKIRIEGKEYIVKDGDVMHVRFNI